MKGKATLVSLLAVTATAIGLGLIIAASNNTADASDALTRATRAQPDRDAYFPNTEDLAPDEMRIIACGTGMPSARESQAASCFLVELGNGDKFIFDGGTGSDARIGALEIPYDLLDKIFISHLHTDHWGSFPAYYVGGWVAGRTVPMRV
jgi:ribonuclease Z